MKTLSFLIALSLIALVGCDSEVPETTTDTVSTEQSLDQAPTQETTAITPDPVTTTPAADPPVITPSPSPSPEPRTISINSVDDLDINEAQTLSITLSASANGQPVFSCTGCPAFSSLNSSTGELSFSPSYTDAGSYNITVTGTNEDATASASFLLVIHNVNRIPAFNNLIDKAGSENQSLSFSVNATDPDGDSVTITASGLPSGASFNGSNFSWTPSYSQSGSYTVTFTASDGALSKQQDIAINISNVNRPPIFSLNDQSGAENTALSFSVPASDPDGDSVSISSLSIPSGASFNGSTFSWTPTCSQQGSYTASFRATDGALTTDKTINISIAHTNCYTPSWQTSLSNYFQVSTSGNNIDMSIREITAVDSQTGVTVAYAGIWFDCFNTTGSTSVVMNDVSPHYNVEGYPEMDRGQTIRINIPGAMLTDYLWFLFYAQDTDGAKVYSWVKVQRQNDGTIPAGSKSVVFQGTSYSTSGFCSGSGYTHNN